MAVAPEEPASPTTSAPSPSTLAYGPDGETVVVPAGKAPPAFQTGIQRFLSPAALVAVLILALLLQSLLSLFLRG